MRNEWMNPHHHLPHLFPLPVTRFVNEADPAASIVSPPSSSRKKALKAKPQPVLDDPTGNHRRTQFSAKQLLTMARAAQDIDLFTVPRGEKTARQKVFAQKCNKAGLVGSVPLLLEHLDEMMQWQADPDKFPALDKLLHKFPCFGAPLDALCEAKIATAKLSETQKAKKSQKNKEDKEGGRMIQLMAAARSQKHLTRLLLSSDDDEDSDDAPVIVGDISHTVTENADQGNIRPTVISEKENTSPATTDKKNVQFDATAAAAPTTPVAPAPTTALGDATNTSASPSSGKRSAADASFADDEALPTKKPQLLKKTAKNQASTHCGVSGVIVVVFLI
ncbi:hypothetical protein CPB85DRAFT_1457859 [Mucidula mucida]|nr:hypothetical protein CPB85DRAFT_1457859 [Mucidula mucida]